VTSDADLVQAIASYVADRSAPFDPLQVPVDPSFWGSARAAETLARTCADYGLSPEEAALPAAWRLWLDDGEDLDYLDLRRQAQDGVGKPDWLQRVLPKVGQLPASFFWYLLRERAQGPQEAMLALARGKGHETAKVGLLAVLPGLLETSAGTTKLLWVGKDRLLFDLGGRELELDRARSSLYRILEEPILLGRSKLIPSDACPMTTKSQAQADLLRHLDLEQSVFPAVGTRDELRCWLTSPPSFAWVGPSDSATYYRVAAGIFGLSCVPAVACFMNPSTHESCCVQASVPASRPGLADPPAELLAADYVLGVASRPPPVVDAAGRAWFGGPVSLFREGRPAGALPKKIDPAELRAELLACGCDPAQASGAARRLAELQATSRS